MTENVWETCIYVVVSSDGLRASTRQRGRVEFRFQAVWKDAIPGLGNLYQLWLEAHTAQRGLPVLIRADASPRLEFWGMLVELHVDGDSTRLAVDRLRQLPEEHDPEELVLAQSTVGVFLPTHAGSYAICRTPVFLDERRPPNYRVIGIAALLGAIIGAITSFALLTAAIVAGLECMIIAWGVGSAQDGVTDKHYRYRYRSPQASGGSAFGYAFIALIAGFGLCGYVYNQLEGANVILVSAVFSIANSILCALIGAQFSGER